MHKVAFDFTCQSFQLKNCERHQILKLQVSMPSSSNVMRVAVLLLIVSSCVAITRVSGINHESKRRVSPFSFAHESDVEEEPVNECNLALFLDSTMKCMTPNNIIKVMEMVRPMLAFLQKTQARRQRKKVPVKIQNSRQFDESMANVASPGGGQDSNGQRSLPRHKHLDNDHHQQSRFDPFSAFNDPLTVVGVVKDDD